MRITIGIAVAVGAAVLAGCSSPQPQAVQQARFEEFCIDNSVEPPLHVDEDLCDRGDGNYYDEPRYAPNWVPYGTFVPPYGQSVLVVRERTMQIPSNRQGITVRVEKYPKANSPIPPYRPATNVPVPTLNPEQQKAVAAQQVAAKPTNTAVASKVVTPGVGVRPAGQTPPPVRTIPPAPKPAAPAPKTGK